jgi:5'-nucleotidase
VIEDGVEERFAVRLNTHGWMEVISGVGSLRILLTNDDGIDAPGLAALRAAVLATFADRLTELYVVAPDSQRSEFSHGVTSALPLRVVEFAERAWATSGTPADCVRVALTTLCPDVDLVLSGINAGANLGTDLITSGTFAAAREAYLRGFTAIAISHYRRPDVPSSWDHAPRWLSGVLEKLADAIAAEDRSLWNVNLPAVAPDSSPEHEICPIDSRPIPLQYRRDDQGGYRMVCDFHGRPRTDGGDVDVCFSGKISISRADRY